MSPDEGFMHNSGCTMFNISVALTTAGLREWMFVAALVFEYIGVLRRAGPQAWVHNEVCLSAFPLTCLEFEPARKRIKPNIYVAFMFENIIPVERRCRYALQVSGRA